MTEKIDEMPLISVIIPAYNIEQYLERCLESVRSQTYRNIQVIIVDDGSQDRTGEIADKFAKQDSRFSVIHKENAGVSAARKTGLEVAQGEYIGFVDGDDFVEPDMFEHLLNNALVYEADISHCGYKMIFPDGHQDVYYGTGKLIKQNHEQGILDLIQGTFVDPGLWNKLYKRCVVADFEKNDIWDSTIRINEDLLMNYLFFAKAERAVYEDIPFYHYILRPGSAATSKRQQYKITDPIKVMERIVEDTQSNQKIFCCAYERYLRTLISAAIQGDWKEEAYKAKLILKEEFDTKRTAKNCKSLKLRGMVFGIVYTYPLYKIIRVLYDFFTGSNRKYDLS